MESNQQFCLRWNNHQSTLISVFDALLESGTLVDCTLAAEGQSLKAHKVVLSACSPYLESLLSQHYEKHPILILKDITFAELKAMLDYMYRGEVNICQDQLGTFLKAAESLQIKGLTDNSSGELPTRCLESARKFVNPYSVPKSPFFPQGLIVEPRPVKLTNNSNTSNNTNNNSSDYVPGLRSGSNGGTSPKRKKHRRSCEDLPRDSNATDASYPSPTVTDSANTPECLVKSEPLVKTEPKFSDEVNNDNSGDELPCDADDEEELDLSRPGTSQTPQNNLQPGWNSTAENAAEEMFPPGQQDQEDGVEEKEKRRMSRKSHGFFPCKQCGRTYIRKDSLQRHVLWECGKEPQFQCPFCPQKCKRKSHHLRHMQRQHRDMLDLMTCPVTKESSAADISDETTTVFPYVETASRDHPPLQCHSPSVPTDFRPPTPIKPPPQ